MKNILTLESFADWVEKQPAEKEYDFCDCCGCACHQYLSAIGLPVKYVSPNWWSDVFGAEHPLPFGFNAAANGYGEPRTFGALALRLRQSSRSGS